MSFLLAFFVSLLFVALTIVITRRFGFVCRPQSDRWHNRCVSLHGGVAIWLSFLLVFFLSGLRPESRETVPLVLASFMMLVGLYDDVFKLNPRSKLLSQLLVSGLVIDFGLGFTFSNVIWLNWFLTAFWIVGLTNAVNLLDNMDGASAGSVFLTMLCLSLLPWQPAPWLANMSLVLAGCLLGFLVFNFYPAKIFMGDSGSLSLGTFTAILLMQFSQTIPQVSHTVLNIPSPLLIPALLVIVPIVDTTFVTVNRLLNGFPVSLGDKGHITHRLSYLFQSDWLSVLCLYLYQLIVCLIIASYHWTLFYPLALLTVYLLYKMTRTTNRFVWKQKFQPSEEALSSHRYLFLKRHPVLHWIMRFNSRISL
jgi:UDP-GlcNAc:undecaprenyl-phosphate GlcNAc-1-phosphate transferase